jgi:gluconate 2-dehydrogenase gamma chain
MHTRGTSRRAFLSKSATGLGAAWLASNYPAIVAAQEFVRTAAEAGYPAQFAFFAPDEAVEIEALTAEIIPTDETPGAREARCAAFIDRALVTFETERQADYEKGLEELAAATRKLYPKAHHFSSLAAEEKTKVLESIEHTRFFALVRAHTITGFFADPLHGGNHGEIGWQLVHYDHSLEHEPPFGYYDALPRTRG